VLGAFGREGVEGGVVEGGGEVTVVGGEVEGEVAVGGGW